MMICCGMAVNVESEDEEDECTDCEDGDSKNDWS
jgi:hypothetical protein